MGGSGGSRRCAHSPARAGLSSPEARAPDHARGPCAHRTAIRTPSDTAATPYERYTFCMLNLVVRRRHPLCKRSNVPRPATSHPAIVSSCCCASTLFLPGDAGRREQGKWVTVTVKSGQQFVGILHTCCVDREIGVVLSMAREKLGPDAIVPKVEEKLVILSKDFVQLVANDVDLYNDEIIEGAVKNQGACPISRTTTGGGQPRGAQIAECAPARSPPW